MDKIRELYCKYRQLILYVLFGAGTTAVDFSVYWLCYDVLRIENVLSTAVALVLSILFAFVTNRTWVFENDAKGAKAFFVQMAEFYGCRLLSSLITLVTMWWTVDVMHWNGLVMKLLVNVVVIIFNYVASKFVIFKKRDGAPKRDV